MENSDQIGSDEVIERRVARLEQIVTNYKVIVAGCDGMVRGGFGKLRAGKTIEERIENLKLSASEFHLQVSNLNLNRNGLQPIAVDLLDDDVTSTALGT